MKRLLATFSACAFALAIGAGSSLAASAATAPQVVTINASASALFTPAQITVHAGQPVQLKLVGQSGVHSIESSELGIPNTMILPGSTKTVTFTPAKPGTYIVHCGLPCGTQHAKMTIAIKVI